MNQGGLPYRIANAENFDTENLAATTEFFDVYSLPIRSIYSQVHWTGHGDIPIPSDVVDRFSHGKAMAVVGYEVDQVRVDEKTGEEVSVPITWAYNHHYMAFLYDRKKAQLVQKATTPETAHMSHGSSTVWVVEPLEEKGSGATATLDDLAAIPHWHFFSEGNGGEMRKSYHSYPKGYAQLIQSPDTFSVTPMQIDTWNRNMANATFLPGPLPKSSKIRDGAAGYNPILECPCSDRLPKEWGMTYTLDPDHHADRGAAAGSMDNSTECFGAVSGLIPALHFTHRVIQDPDVDQCTATLKEDGVVLAVWNAAARTPDGKTAGEDDTKNKVVGVARDIVNVTVVMDAEAGLVMMTLSGPSDKWFGVGFGAASMCIKMDSDECLSGGPYAVIVEGEHVEERKLDYHGKGRSLEVPSVVVHSNFISMDGTTRVVKLSRPSEGPSPDFYTFDPKAGSLKIIVATGCDMAFAQHCGHGPNAVHFLPMDTPKSVYRAGIHGSIGDNSFDKSCATQPKGDLVVQNNPTCTVQDYQGGLSCCRHEHYLLDSDQEIPWQDQPLEYRLKFRFYFENYQAASGNQPPSHKNLNRVYWQTEAGAGEYDVPQCTPNTPPSQCVHVITSQWQVRECLDANLDMVEGVHLIYAAPHCHAPVCLSMELYNADTGQLLCHMEPLRGTGSSAEQYDEAGYIAIPPCLWSEDPNRTEGLPLPDLLQLNTTLLSIKRANSTFPHTGEMASWQMRGVVIPREVPQYGGKYWDEPKSKSQKLRASSFKSDQDAREGI
jgi:Stress up-regulated Nod 19